jgi:poly(3-hydroxybutyrate) depolymerase
MGITQVDRPGRAVLEPASKVPHARWRTTSHGTQAMFTTLRRLGPRAPVVAFPDGGDHSYWHDRADGAWGRYVTDEVIPQVTRRFDTDPRRVAIGGISMGGFGALDLAVHMPGRWCAVGAHSPALWQTAGETAAGAFDARGRRDDGDYWSGRWSGRWPGRWSGRWPGRWSGRWPGRWSGRWPDYLRFYATALADCR